MVRKRSNENEQHENIFVSEAENPHRVEKDHGKLGNDRSQEPRKESSEGERMNEQNKKRTQNTNCKRASMSLQLFPFPSCCVTFNELKMKQAILQV